MGYHCDVLAGRRGNATDLLDYLALSQPTSVLIQRGGLARPQVVSNACASGTSALGLAFRYVKSGRDDLALVAGYDPMSAFTFWGFNSLRLVTPERCRPFDTRRSGLVLGEGAAAFVLEERDRAVARGAPIFGEILGYGETNDAHHPTHPHPEGRGALAAMNRALHEAGLSPADLDYVNAHGTGTRANDASEALALATLLGDAAASVPVSSTKGHVGHCLGAAGALEAAFTWIALGRGFLPPTVNLEEPDPAFPLQFVRGASRRTSAEFALSNSFGFGGSNASVVLRRGEATP
jgi:3-oxoacyl-[acyl-carrier-protein] synthase II